MSYVPYHPDVWPAEPVEDLRPKMRVLRWACAAMLYLLGIVAWIVWMKMPPRIQPPIATIHLSDGTELRLVHYNVGHGPGIQGGETFGNRIRRENVQTMDASFHDPQGGIWMVFTQFDPRLKSFQKPNINSFDILEPGSPYTLRPSLNAPGNGPYSVLLFPAIPWSERELDVQIVHEGQSITAKIPNPVNGWVPAALPPSPANTVKSSGVVALPHQLEQFGFTVVAEKVTFSSTLARTGSSGSHTADAHVRVTHPVARSSDYVKKNEWFDQRGNVVRKGVLPWSEPVWGLRVTIQETASFPMPAERLSQLGTFLTPGPGQATKLAVPSQMKRDGVSDIFLIGAGSYSWSGNKLLAMSGGGTAGKAVATASGVTRGGSLNEPAWGLYILGMNNSRPGEPEKRANLRVRKGDAFCVHGSSGSSSWGSYRQQHFGSYRMQKGGQVPAGEEISVEAFFPETHTFEFLLSRPDFVPNSQK